jgi:hypothetical protein
MKVTETLRVGQASLGVDLALLIVERLSEVLRRPHARRFGG